MTKTRWKTAQYFEIRWWQRYLRKKSVLEYLNWKKNYWTEFLHELPFEINDEGGLKILDAGCGPAGIFINFSNAKVTALDPLICSYNELSHFDENWYTNTSFYAQKLEDFSTDKKFDVIFCINAINHVEDIKEGWRKLFGVASRNAKVVVTIDAHKYKLLKQLFRSIPGDILHPHQYSVDDYGKMMCDAGFQITDVQCLKRNKIFDYYLLCGVKK